MGRTVKEIINQSGGVARIARATNKTAQAVYYWQDKGIPWPVWHTLMRELPGLTPQEIYQANCRVAGLPINFN